MSFMHLDITDKEHGYRAETREGIYYYPLGTLSPDEIASEWGDKLESLEEIYGYFGRFSAPGYLDCTEWSFDTNKRRLKADLMDMY